MANGPSARRRGYTGGVSLSFHELAIGALALDAADRLRLASELIDSVEGPEDPGWSQAWASELDRRVADAERSGERGRPWNEVRSDLLKRLASR